MYYFIVNPSARRGKALKIWRRIKKQLDHKCVEYEAHFTQEPGDARRIAREISEGYRQSCVIITVGGDGTVNEVVDGLDFCTQITLGFIPVGIESGLARNFRLPHNPRRCLKKILNPKNYCLADYGILTYGDGECLHRRFVVRSGIGFDASVCQTMANFNSHPLLIKFLPEKIRFIVIGCYQLFMAKPEKGYIVLDGEKKVEFNHIYFISVRLNLSREFGFRFGHKNNEHKGLLSVCVIHHRQKRKVLGVLLKTMYGKYTKASGVRFYECQEVDIHVEQPQPVHVDGESCKYQDNLQVNCVKKKIRILI